MKKRVLIPLTLVVLLAVLALVAVATLTTGTGLRITVRTLLPLVPGQVEIDSIDGRLIGPIRLAGLRWRDDGGELDIERLELQWQPSRLLSRQVRVDRLHAAGIAWRGISTATADDQPGEFSVPSLPLAISVGDLLLEQIVVVHGETTLPIDRLQLAAEIDADGYRIASVSVAAPALDADGALTLGSAAPHPVDARLRWRSTLAALPSPLDGTLTAAGSLADLQIAATLSGPLDIELDGIAADLTGAPTFAGNLDIARFDPGLLTGAPGMLPVSGRLGLDYAGAELTLNGRLEAPQWLPDAALIDLAAGFGSGSIDVNTLRVELEGRPLRLEASGSLAGDLTAIDLALRWSDLGWPLDAPAVTSPGGAATLTGSLAAWSLNLEGRAGGTALPPATVALRGDGTASRFDVAALSATFERGVVRGSGRLAWEGTPAFEANLTARGLDPGLWHAGVSGTLDVATDIRGRFPSGGPELTASIRRLAGTLNGQPLTGTGGVEIAGDTIRLTGIDLRAGEAVVQASGTIGTTLDLRWDVAVPDLAVFVPAGAGRIRSSGTAGGPRSRPAVEGVLQLDGFALANFAAASVSARVDVGTAPDSAANLELEAADISVSGLQIDRATAASSGTLGAHRIELRLTGAGTELDAGLRGALADGTWRGALEALRLDGAASGAWQLQQAATLLVGGDRLELAPACLLQDAARVCAEADLAVAGTGRVAVNLEALPVAAFRALLPPGLVYDGTLAGSATMAAAAAQDWRGTGELALTGGRVLRRDDEGDEVLVAADNGRLDARFDPAGVATRLDLDLRGTGRVAADVRVPFDGSGALDGTVDVRVEHLGLVTVFVPQISHLRGTVEARLDVAGTLANPDLTGDIALQASEMLFPDLGVTLRDTDLNVTTAGNQLDFRARGSSGDGELAIDGVLRWQAGQPNGEVRLTGDAFRAVDLPQMRLDASPSLVLSIAGRSIDLSGSLNVPAARITPIDISTGVGVSADQVIVGAQAPGGDGSRWQVGGRIELSAGDDVTIAGYGLDGRLTGNVLVIETPGQPTTARGSLAIVDGQYRAYGQRLDIETGRLEFTGGQIDNPGLNLTASRTVQDVVVGVQVRGALRQPTLTLYSVPPLSDSQTLSYLVTGRSIQDLSQADQTAVSDAATRLALRGGSYLASSVGRSLGLDSVEFAGDGDTANTSLVIGKHLSPRLFVSYGIGLFESLNTLRLRYHINSRLTLETQSGQVSSADLLYSFER